VRRSGFECRTGLRGRDGADGEIRIRGPMVMPGYWNAPQETAQALRGDGWFHHRARGGSGMVTVHRDRIKEMIYPEDGLQSVPRDVEDCWCSTPPWCGRRWGQADVMYGREGVRCPSAARARRTIQRTWRYARSKYTCGARWKQRRETRPTPLARAVSSQ